MQDCVGREGRGTQAIPRIDLGSVMSELMKLMDAVENMDSRLAVMHKSLEGRMEGLEKMVGNQHQVFKEAHLNEREHHEARIAGAEKSSAVYQQQLADAVKRLDAQSKEIDGKLQGGAGLTARAAAGVDGTNMATPDDFAGLLQQQLKAFALLTTTEVERVLREQFQQFGIRSLAEQGKATEKMHHLIVEQAEQRSLREGSGEHPAASEAKSLQLPLDAKVLRGSPGADGHNAVHSNGQEMQAPIRTDLVELQVVDPLLQTDFDALGLPENGQQSADLYSHPPQSADPYGFPQDTHSWAILPPQLLDEGAEDGAPKREMTGTGESPGREDSGLVTPSNTQMMEDAAQGMFEEDDGLLEDWGEDEDHKHNVVVKEDASLGGVFSNDDDVSKPIHRVEDYYYETGCCQALALSDRFQNLTVAVVVVNAFYIGIDADWNQASSLYDADLFFVVGANFFCVYFTFEWLVRFLAFRNKCDSMRDGWFRFDTFLVATMVLDTWVIMVILKTVAGGTGQVNIPVQPLRMLRLFKLTRMARLMKAFPELVIMVKGLVRSLRAISSSGILIMLMLYTWAILLHNLMKDEDKLNAEFYDATQQDFTTVFNCMWMLFLQGTLFLDNSGIMMTTLIFHKEFHVVIAGIAFFSYALLSALLILQMLIGVLCDVVARVGAEGREADAIGLVKQELLASLKQYAGDDGLIEQTELFKVMVSRDSKRVLKKLNINFPYLLELQKMMFPKKTSKASIKAVLQLMVMCRGDNNATVSTLAGGFCFLAREIQDLGKKEVKAIHDSVQRVEDKLGSSSLPITSTTV